MLKLAAAAVCLALARAIDARDDRDAPTATDTFSIPKVHLSIYFRLSECD
jgi:hypothetical protein